MIEKNNKILNVIINLIQNRKIYFLLGGFLFINIIFIAINGGNIFNDKSIIINNNKNNINNNNIDIKNHLNDKFVQNLSKNTAKVVDNINKENKYTLLSFIEGIDCSNSNNNYVGLGIMTINCNIIDNNAFNKSINYISNFLETENDFGKAYYFDSKSKANLIVNGNKLEIKITQTGDIDNNKLFLAIKEQGYIFSLKAKNNFGKTFIKGKYIINDDFNLLINGFKNKYPDLIKSYESDVSVTYSSKNNKYIDDMYIDLKDNNLRKFDQVGYINIDGIDYRVYIYYISKEINGIKPFEFQYLKFKNPEILLGGFLISDAKDDKEAMIVFMDKSLFR